MLGEKLSLILDANDNKRNILLVDQTIKPDDRVITDDLNGKLLSVLNELYEKGILQKWISTEFFCIQISPLNPIWISTGPEASSSFGKWISSWDATAYSSGWMRRIHKSTRYRVNGVDTSDLSLNQLYSAFGAYLDISGQRIPSGSRNPAWMNSPTLQKKPSRMQQARPILRKWINIPVFPTFSLFKKTGWESSLNQIR